MSGPTMKELLPTRLHLLFEAKDGPAEGRPIEPAAAPLGAYWVGEHDVYAAHSPEQALELCEGHSGMPDTFDMDDVRELTAVELDKPLQEEDGTPCGTVRSMLGAMTAPGELVSFE